MKLDHMQGWQRYIILPRERPVDGGLFIPPPEILPDIKYRLLRMDYGYRNFMAIRHTWHMCCNPIFLAVLLRERENRRAKGPAI